jgi:aryl-alcohol dehydrogenase-like predicted oxidoreductase
LDGLHEVASEVNRSPAQVAINWLLRKPGVTAPIIGARGIKQLESNLGSTGWSLSSDQVTKLDVASEVPLPYPYDFIKKLGRE